MRVNRWHPKSELVIQMLADGCSYKQIKAALKINSDETIRRIKRRSTLTMLVRTPKPRNRSTEGTTTQLPLTVQLHQQQPVMPYSATWQLQAMQALAKWAQAQSEGFTTPQAMQAIKTVNQVANPFQCRQIINACVVAGHLMRTGYKIFKGKEESLYRAVQAQTIAPGLSG